MNENAITNTSRDLQLGLIVHELGALFVLQRLLHLALSRGDFALTLFCFLFELQIEYLNSDDEAGVEYVTMAPSESKE